jgi:transmembrane sensor
MNLRARHDIVAIAPPTEDALAWAIALQENPDDAELRARFQAWRASNEAAWAEASKVCGLVGEALADAPRQMHPGWGMRAGWRLALGAAVAAVAAAIMVFLLPAILVRVQADHLTGISEISTLMLEDGSKVTLGADSAVDLDFTGQDRRIRLLRGEAFFEVAPDPARPFRVEADDLSAVALGTAFDVLRGTEGITVTVAHGIVGIDRDGARLDEPLSAGAWARIGWAGEVLAEGAVDPAMAGAWRSGMLMVGDWPLSEVVAQLRRYYGGLILAPDGDLAGLRVTGTYRLADPVAALGAASYPHGIVVRQVAPWVVVLSPD